MEEKAGREAGTGDKISIENVESQQKTRLKVRKLRVIKVRIENL